MTKKSHPTHQHTEEFSRRAKSYQEHNIIQKRVVKHLLQKITSKPKTILDLGCGSGAVYNLIDWEFEHFVGVDKAKEMSRLHPKSSKITLLEEDFETLSLFEKREKFAITISSSALQWAKDLPSLLEKIASISEEIALAIFCEGTFQTIYQRTNQQSFLPNHQTLLKELEKHFHFTYELQTYHLHFKDNLSKFRYIKQSGVSGGMKRLTIAQTRALIQNYPLDYLEFEVLFIWGKSLK